MRRVIVVQARTTSTRLPRKVLMDLCGRPMLAQQLRRLKLCRRVEDIVLATTRNASDDPIVELAEVEQVRWFRGDEDDVLGRYMGAAREAKAEMIIRITSDCPLIDPGVTDQVVRELEENSRRADYASNVIRRTFPQGLDTEVFLIDVLERMFRLAESCSAHEHVTHFLLHEHPDLFLTRSVEDCEDNSDLRWTVDQEEDLRMVRQLYETLDLDCTDVSYADIVKYVRSHPEVAAINVGIRQKLP